MNKKKLALIIFVAFSLRLIAQSDSITRNHFFLFASGGAGIPVGQFASINGSTFGKNGTELNLFANLYFVKNSIYDITVLAKYNLNSIDLQGYFDGFHSGLGTYTALKAGNFNVFSLMVGPEVNVPKQRKNFWFNMRFLIGPDLNFYPYLSYNSFSVQNNQLVFFSNYEKWAPGFGLAYSFGVGFKAALTKQLTGTLNADYLIASSSAKGTDRMTDSSGNISYSTTNTSGTIFLISITAGIGYQF